MKNIQCLKKYSKSFVHISFSLIMIFTINSCTKSNNSEDDKKDYLQVQRRKLLQTKGDLKTIGDAIYQYTLSTGSAPDISDIAELRDIKFSEFSRLGNLTDAWGNDFLYLRSDEDESLFFVASAGKDGKFEGWEQKGRYRIINFDHYNKDIIFSNGGFIYTSN